jgi:transposase
MQVLAPGKTPRASADRVKTDRKDAERLWRLLLVGQPAPIAVRSPEAEAATELSARTRSGAI